MEALVSTSMKAMQLFQTGLLAADSQALQAVDIPLPEPGPGEVRLRVAACGVCHTELDQVEGRLPPTRLPVIPGHQVVGTVDALGEGAGRHALGHRLGVGWIWHSSGSKTENTDPEFEATGRDADGGYAEYMVVPESYACPVPAVFSDTQAAPLLCAGGVGYRALKLTGIADGQALGLTGFGGSAHLVLQLARHLYPDLRIHVFARDAEARQFALELGASWAGDTTESAPEALNAIIDTTPAWKPVVEAMAQLVPGGRLVINAIRKEDADKEALLELRYETHLWQEKEIKTVANVTRRDIAEFLQHAAEIPISAEVETYPLADANQALLDLKFKPVRGAKVLLMNG
jgi:propanol-preferring alcohol dehydrogenase